MRKTFQLVIEGKHPDRILEAVKHEIRKYIKRERRRELPEGTDYWDFDCKFGTLQESAETIHLTDITGRIDGVVKDGGAQFYIEILAKTAKRTPRPAGDAAVAQDELREED
jgi:hypothetical protein